MLREVLLSPFGPSLGFYHILKSEQDAVSDCHDLSDAG